MLFIVTVILSLVFFVAIDCNIEKNNKDGIIIVCLIGFAITMLATISGGINLAVDLITKESKESELELLYT